MKLSACSRPVTVLVLSLGLAYGCASTPPAEEPAAEPEVAPAETTETAGPSQAAIDAINDAKRANHDVRSVGYEWRDTDDLIKEAEAAAHAGDNERAIALANQARRQALAAMRQYEDEKAKADAAAAAAAAAAASAASMSSDSSMMASASDSYEVMRGDSLWGIAGKDVVYADPYQWPLIYKANSDKIRDADLIYPGQVFTIERGVSLERMESAIRHARNRGAWSVGNVEDSDIQFLAQ